MRWSSPSPVTCISLLLLFTLIPPASADVIPPGMIDDDVIAVAHLDLVAADHITWARTGLTVVGGNYSLLTTKIRGLVDQHKMLAQAGVASAGMVVRGPDAEGDMWGPVFYLNLKAGTDIADAAAAIERLYPDANAVRFIGKTALMLVPDRTNVPESAKPGELHKTYEKHLAALGDAHAKVIIISNKAMAAKYERPEPKPNHSWSFGDDYLARRALRHRLFSSKLITVALRAGEKPSVNITIETATGKAAHELVDELRVTILGILGDRANSKEMFGYPSPTSFVELVVLRALHPRAQIKDATVSITLDPTALNKLGRQWDTAHTQSEDARKEALTSLHIRQFINMTMLYAAANNDALPDKLEDLEKIHGKEYIESLLKHPRTGEKTGFRWIKPAAKLGDVKTPASTVVIQELRNGQANPDGFRGYLDGRTAKGLPD